MPRGVPKNGFRAPRGSRKVQKMLTVAPVAAPVVFETDAEIEQKLADRFEILETMTDAAISGDARAVIVSGPAGLGKSFTVEKALAQWDPNAINHKIVKGYIRATGLYKLLYAHRAPGQVLVFDDADEVFLDDTAINLLKAACDSSDRRIISYITEGSLIDEETAERLPKSFQFEGTVIFITNYDFDAMIERGSKLAPHLQALVSRAHYIDMAMKTKRDYLIRIRQVVRAGLLRNNGLDDEAQLDVIDFIEDNQDRLRELSLRMALKIAAIRRRGSANWKKVARVTCCKS
jgi:hypothetical protein